MIEFLPCQTTKKVITDVGAELGLPGMQGGLIDARPHMNRLVDELTMRGYALVRLTGGDTANKIVAKLNKGEIAKVP